jgi:hypothetical protein
LFNTINSDYPIGANNGTVGTTGAYIRMLHISVMISFSVYFLGQFDNLCGAGWNADSTTFAAFHIDHDSTSHFCHN